ncbi:hypothetical protein [Streptomyces rochei]|uniref:hypothetical protein n=1 Tax=Streptomyces rochei TaxID=1928 RepID=UPI0033A626DD
MGHNHAQKNAARQHQDYTGRSSYQAALNDLRTEQALWDRPITVDCHVAPGVEHVLGHDGVQAQFDKAVRSHVSGNRLRCAVCDLPIDLGATGPVDLGATALVGLGVVLRAASARQRSRRPRAVWTHGVCASSQVWAPSRLAEVRHQHGTPVDPAHLPQERIWSQKELDRLREVTAAAQATGRPPEPLFPTRCLYSITAHRPVCVVSSGEPDRYGELGFHARMLNSGLTAAASVRRLRELPPVWVLRYDAGGRPFFHGERTGLPYPDLSVPPSRWSAAAAANEEVLVLCVPYETLADDASVGEQGVWRAVDQAASKGMLFGALARIHAS